MAVLGLEIQWSWVIFEKFFRLARVKSELILKNFSKLSLFSSAKPLAKSNIFTIHDTNSNNEYYLFKENYDFVSQKSVKLSNLDQLRENVRNLVYSADRTVNMVNLFADSKKSKPVTDFKQVGEVLYV